uniref:Sugar transporter SWEET1 n=1 Tax=Lygus hesperus TaxID=30085 RepID=A0A0A9ZC43_LYGHE
MGSILLSIISTAATFASIGLLLSPLFTIRDMVKNKSVGVMTVSFFCAQYMNCVSWSMYGILQQAWPLVLCNSFGTVVAVICMLNFLYIVHQQERCGRPAISTTYK